MKKDKIWSIWMMLVLVLGTTISFSSCSSDDDDNKQNAEMENHESIVITPEMCTSPSADGSVDMGLSVKWSAFNVGVHKDILLCPESLPHSGVTYRHVDSTGHQDPHIVGCCGQYFAWGETAEQSDDKYDWSSYNWCSGSYTALTKYCTDASSGMVDNKTTLDPEDDAARMYFGDPWRMPTREEMEELRNKDNCTWKWATMEYVKGCVKDSEDTENNVIYLKAVKGTAKGYYITSKKTGNSIFLPAAGHKFNGMLQCKDTHVTYWSSSLYTDGLYGAYFLDMGSDSKNWIGYRCYGYPVRAVRK